MNERLKNALDALQNLDRSLSPVALGNAREDALIEGLHGLADEYGKKINPTFINAWGEMDFNIIGDMGPGNHLPSGQYGEELAAFLSEIATRTGTTASVGHVLPENGWTMINHFEVEKLLLNVAEKLLNQEPENSAPGMR